MRAGFAANVFKSVAARPIRLMLPAAVAAPLAKNMICKCDQINGPAGRYTILVTPPDEKSRQTAHSLTMEELATLRFLR